MISRIQMLIINILPYLLVSLTILLDIYFSDNNIISSIKHLLAGSLVWFSFFIFIFNLWFLSKVGYHKIISFFVAFGSCIFYYLFLFVTASSYDNYLHSIG